MSDNNYNRRDALKFIGTSSLMTVGYVGAASASSTSGVSEAQRQLSSHDIKVYNSGSSAVNVVVEVVKSDENGVAGEEIIAKPQVPQLTDSGQKHEKNISLSKGKYTVKVRAMFKGIPPKTAKCDIAIPRGGIPDYLSVKIRITSSKDVDVYKVER